MPAAIAWLGRRGFGDRPTTAMYLTPFSNAQRSAWPGFSNIEAHHVIVHHESAADVFDHRIDDREALLGVGGNRRGVVFVDRQHERIAAAGARHRHGAVDEHAAVTVA